MSQELGWQTPKSWMKPKGIEYLSAGLYTLLLSAYRAVSSNPSFIAQN
jgi:hypothetical protein